MSETPLQEITRIEEERDAALALIEELRGYCALMSRKDAFIGFRLAYRELIKVMLGKITEFQEDVSINRLERP